MDIQNLNIKQNNQFKIFFVRVPGGIAQLKYKTPSQNLIEYYETYVPVSSRKRGIGRELVEYGIRYAKSRNLRILPKCPFVKKIINEHPEYKGILHQVN